MQRNTFFHLVFVFSHRFFLSSHICNKILLSSPLAFRPHTIFSPLFLFFFFCLFLILCNGFHKLFQILADNMKWTVVESSDVAAVFHSDQGLKFLAMCPDHQLSSWLQRIFTLNIVCIFFLTWSGIWWCSPDWDPS